MQSEQLSEIVVWSTNGIFETSYKFCGPFELWDRPQKSFWLFLGPGFRKDFAVAKPCLFSEHEHRSCLNLCYCQKAGRLRVQNQTSQKLRLRKQQPFFPLVVVWSCFVGALKRRKMEERSVYNKNCPFCHADCILQFSAYFCRVEKFFGKIFLINLGNVLCIVQREH